MTAERVGLLGETGFVGATLKRAYPQAQGFSSRTVAQAHGQHFDRLFCAAAPGSMFHANRDPEGDARRVDAVIASLRQIKADHFVLISTIAVLDRFDSCQDETATAFQQNTPYGRNRRRLEVACNELFDSCLVVRLPALFGIGLAKNFVFDLLNPMPTMLVPDAYARLEAELPKSLREVLPQIYGPHDSLDMLVIDRAALDRLSDRESLEVEARAIGIDAVMFHHRDTTYQFYDMSCLAADIEIASEAGLDVIHLAPEPLTTAAVHFDLTGRPMRDTTARLHHEDMRTRHNLIWNAERPYMRDGPSVMAGLRTFFEQMSRG